LSRLVHEIVKDQKLYFKQVKKFTNKVIHKNSDLFIIKNDPLGSFFTVILLFFIDIHIYPPSYAHYPQILSKTGDKHIPYFIILKKLRIITFFILIHTLRGICG